MCAAVQLPLSHSHTPSTHHSTSSRVPVLNTSYYISIAGNIFTGSFNYLCWAVAILHWNKSFQLALLEILPQPISFFVCYRYKNHVKGTVVIRCYSALWLWGVYYLDYRSNTKFLVSFQATCVVLLCKGSSGLPSSPVQYDTFHLWWWRNHLVQPYQGPRRSFISNRVHLLSMYFYCCYLDFFILEAQELLLECPWCMNTLFQTDQTFLRIFLVLDTMKQMKYEGVGVASARTTLPIIVLFYPGKCSLHGSGLVHLEDIVQSSVFFQRWAATASS